MSELRRSLSCTPAFQSPQLEQVSCRVSSVCKLSRLNLRQMSLPESSRCAAHVRLAPVALGCSLQNSVKRRRFRPFVQTMLDAPSSSTAVCPCRPSNLSSWRALCLLSDKHISSHSLSRRLQIAARRRSARAQVSPGVENV